MLNPQLEMQANRKDIIIYAKLFYLVLQMVSDIYSAVGLSWLHARLP